MTRTEPTDIERCRQQAEARPESASSQFNLGLAYTRAGQVSRAETCFRRALEIDPDLVEAWVNLGGALLLQWDFKGALEANQEALNRRADELLAHYNMGQACLYLGDADGVVRCNRKVTHLDENHAAGHYFLAVGLLASNRVEEARKALSRAMALGHRPTPEFLRGLERAELAEAQGQPESPQRDNATGRSTSGDAKEDGDAHVHEG